MGLNIDELPGGLTYAKLSQLLADAGYVMPAFEQNVAGGVAAGQSTRRQPLVSANRRLAVGLATKLFDYQFSAAVQNTAIWNFRNAGSMLMTQGSGTVLFNSSGTVLTSGAGCQLSSWRYFNFPGNGTVSVEMETQFTATPLANQMFICGVFPSVAAGALPTDGVYFKYSSAGLYGVVNFNGVETPTAQLLTSLSSNQNYNLKIDISNSSVDFWVGDTLLATQAPAAANPEPMNWGALPLTMQLYNTALVSGSPMMQVKVGSVVVTQRDIATEKLWENQQALSGLNANQGSEGGTMGTTALYSNSLAAGAGAAMTNTTAALTAGFGGQFSAQPTLAAGTDGILQSYQNPVGTINQIPRSIMIKGVWFQGMVTTAFTGGPVYYAFSLAFGHTAVSMATADGTSFSTSPTTKAPRRIPLGWDSYVVTAPVGTIGSRIYQQFQTPVVINPGEFIAICAKNVGTVTSVGVITYLVGFDACYE